MIACNNDGLWNQNGAALDFVIPPAVYQTMWFKVSLLLCAVVLTWLFFQLRLRQMAAQMQSRLAERMGERERIARELHDTLLQGFHGLMLRFQVVNQLIPKDEKARAVMEDAMNRADLLMSESRERIRNLRHETGAVAALPDALSSVGEEPRQDGSIGFRLVVEGTPRELNAVIRDEMYLIGREAMINSFTHSRGSMVEVEINFDHAGVRLRVRDDGKGIPPEVLRIRRSRRTLGALRDARTLGENRRPVQDMEPFWSRHRSGAEGPRKIAYPREVKTSLWEKVRHLYARWKSDSSLVE